VVLCQAFEVIGVGGAIPSTKGRSPALVAGMKSALTVAQKIERVTFDSQASEAWVETTYPRLTREMPGLLGAMTARAETHVIRLATLYALLDSSSIIRPTHLHAALGVWEYCSDSVSYLFGDVLGNDAGRLHPQDSQRTPRWIDADPNQSGCISIQQASAGDEYSLAAA